MAEPRSGTYGVLCPYSPTNSLSNITVTDTLFLVDTESYFDPRIFGFSRSQLVQHYCPNVRLVHKDHIGTLMVHQAGVLKYQFGGPKWPSSRHHLNCRWDRNVWLWSRPGWGTSWIQMSIHHRETLYHRCFGLDLSVLDRCFGLWGLGNNRSQGWKSRTRSWAERKLSNRVCGGFTKQDHAAPK